MRILVTYYSRDGHTKKIAETIAAKIGADIARIEDVKSRSGILGYLRSGFGAALGSHGQIHPVNKDPDQYDLVILGTPVWTGSLTPPMRSYIADQSRKFKQVAFFCTEGSEGGTRVFKTMGSLCNQQPVATLEITAADFKTGAHVNKVEAFTQHLG